MRMVWMVVQRWRWLIETLQGSRTLKTGRTWPDGEQRGGHFDVVDGRFAAFHGQRVQDYRRCEIACKKRKRAQFLILNRAVYGYGYVQ